MILEIFLGDNLDAYFPQLEIFFGTIDIQKINWTIGSTLIMELHGIYPTTIKTNPLQLDLTQNHGDIHETFPGVIKHGCKIIEVTGRFSSKTC